ncbi:MAG: D-2-hydroxyacid dehydrogenase [Planctomycetota bacterium]
MEQAPPKIVVLDGVTTNPGDVDWSPLEAVGDVTINDRSTPDQAEERAATATAVMTNKVPVGEDLLAQCPSIVYAGVLATGFNQIDLDACRRRGVTVTNIPAYSTESTAQHAFALLLELTNRTGRIAANSAERWPASKDFSYTEGAMTELDGLTCGVVGFGAIGKAFCRRARAFGMKVVAHTADPAKHEAAANEIGVTFVSLDELLSTSDAISLHCPLTDDTKGLIGGGNIGKLKKGVLLVNTGRGPLLDEADVAEALRDGTIAQAGVDVLSTEPPSKDNPLLSAPNIVVTPHVAWATRAARLRLIDIAADNVRSFFAGEPKNVVS